MPITRRTLLSSSIALLVLVVASGGLSFGGVYSSNMAAAFNGTEIDPLTPPHSR